MSGRSACLTFATLGCLCASVIGQQPSINATQRAAVIKLRVHRDGQPDETAAAILVGWTDERLYFATAYHAIGPADDKPVQDVRVQWVDRPDIVPARVFESFDAALDLGVVSIARTGGLQLKPTLLIGDPRQGTAVRVVGHPAGGDWSSWDGTIQNGVAAGGDPTHFVYSGSVRLTDGYSGGAVFDASGRFVGLHSQSSVAYGVGMASAEILRRLKAWQVPTTEFSTDLSPTTIQELRQSAKLLGLIEHVADDETVAVTAYPSLLSVLVLPDFKPPDKRIAIGPGKSLDFQFKDVVHALGLYYQQGFFPTNFSVYYADNTSSVSTGEGYFPDVAFWGHVSSRPISRLIIQPQATGSLEIKTIYFFSQKSHNRVFK